MVIDKFGRSNEFNNNKKTPWKFLALGYVVTSDGHIDVQSKRICNLKTDPVENNDATTKKYVDSKLRALQQEFRKYVFTNNVNVKNLTDKYQLLENGDIVNRLKNLEQNDVSNRIKQLEDANIIERINKLEQNKKAETTSQ